MPALEAAALGAAALEAAALGAAALEAALGSEGCLEEVPLETCRRGTYTEACSVLGSI